MHATSDGLRTWNTPRSFESARCCCCCKSARCCCRLPPAACGAADPVPAAKGNDNSKHTLNAISHILWLLGKTKMAERSGQLGAKGAEGCAISGLRATIQCVSYTKCFEVYVCHAGLSCGTWSCGVRVRTRMWHAASQAPKLPWPILAGIHHVRMLSIDSHYTGNSHIT